MHDYARSAQARRVDGHQPYDRHIPGGRAHARGIPTVYRYSGGEGGVAPTNARSRHERGLAPGGGLAFVLFQKAFADADRQRRHFDELVVGDELDRVFQRELDGRREQDGIVFAGGADVGELLGLDRVHHQVVVPAVNADDHPFIELLARAYEHPAALLQVEEGVGDRFSRFVADEHAVAAVRDFALEGREAVKNVAHEAGAARQGHELALEPDQPAGGHAVLEARTAVAAVDRHIGE